MAMDLLLRCLRGDEVAESVTKEEETTEGTERASERERREVEGTFIERRRLGARTANCLTTLAL